MAEAIGKAQPAGCWLGCVAKIDIRGVYVAQAEQIQPQIGQFLRLRRARIDHDGALGLEPIRKQAPLGVPVVFHRGVIVQMIATEIGKGGGIEL